MLSVAKIAKTDTITAAALVITPAVSPPSTVVAPDRVQREDAAMEKRLAACNLCEAVCGLELTIDDGQVVGVRGNPEDPLSRGHICPKGVAIGDIHADPDRLRRPVRRDRTTGEWVEIGWDEAFDLVADGIATAINEHGKDALGIYLGNPNVHSLGSMTHGVALVQSFRTRNKFSATSVDQLPHQLVGHLLYGHQLLLPVPDIDRTSYFLVFGANPMASNGSLMTVPDFPARLRELDGRRGRMIVFDPRRTETAKVASEHHFIRPGTDAWVLLAMLHTLFAEGLTTPPSYVDGLADVERAISDFTPGAAERASGVPAGVITQVAREFAAADTAAAYGRIGVSTQEFGLVCQWAVQLLNLVTGNTDREGGTLLTSPAIDAIGRGLVGRGHFDRHRSRVRQAPEFAGELPVAVLREEIETPGDGQVRALLTLAGNPVLSTPDGAALDRAIEGLDFYAAVDFYINETTRHADVILPPTSHLERDHYDLVFHLLAVRDTARFSPAVFPKTRRPAPRLGDLPRGQRPGDAPARAEAVSRAPGQEGGPARGQPDLHHRDPAPHRSLRRHHHPAPQAPRGGRHRSAARRPAAGPSVHRGQADPGGAGARGR